MANIFFAVAPTPPPPPPNPWTGGVRIDWYGTDGSVWALTHAGSGVRLAAGVRGLTEPAVERHLSESAGVPGSVYRGSRVLERDVFLPLRIFHGDGTQQWLDYDAAFRSSMNHRSTGVLRVTQPNGQWRELACRPTGDGGKAWSTLLPGAFEWESYARYLVAEDPFWYGPEVKSPLWTAPAPVDFIPGGGAPPFHPGSATTIGSAKLTNPGDESAWPLWTVTGPVDGVSIELDGHTVSYGPLLLGDTLVIDTDPRVQTAWLNGVDVTGSLGSYDFAPIPPGGTLPVAIAMVGGGSLQASFRPAYDRAW